MGTDVVIYHNPECGTSRNALAMIRNAGIEPHVIEYLKTPPSRAMLVSLLARMSIGPRALLRKTGTPFTELGLADPSLSHDALIDAMIAHPILINRPVVVSPLGVKLCRPSEEVLKIAVEYTAQRVHQRGWRTGLRSSYRAMSRAAVQTMSPPAPAISTFERYLSLWVAMCIVVGIALGYALPTLFATIASAEVARVNLVVALLIWLMIVPMFLKIDLAALGSVGKHWKGVGVTLFVNWAVKPFSMALLGTLFLGWLFRPLLPASRSAPT